MSLVADNRGRVMAGAAMGLAAGFAVMSATSGWAITVPSGQPVELNEVLVDDRPGEVWIRFRFVAPQIARQSGSVDYGQAAADMDHLCRNLVLPYLAEYALSPSRVVISLSDRDVPFGLAAPEATQFFEAYRLEDADCIWEEF
ncbi:DUF6497 family protein [Sedimentitalea sp. HM32M-2]|uniref:DUF6497 family protein n=1 Tax=Sedimentitalea sp. HM32M-2 TaxID=3351566 RepID=UPI003636A62A